MLNFSINRSAILDGQPKRSDISKWLKSSILNQYKNVFINISFVDINESKKLNFYYRNKNYATNVISIEYKQQDENFFLLTGDVVLCHEIILDEAKKQNKKTIDHYAHLIIHGVLHLQGLDHELEHDAIQMEAIEIKILSKFDIPNPYNT